MANNYRNLLSLEPAKPRNVGKSYVDAYSSAASARNAMAEADAREEKARDEKSKENALNAMATMEQPEYKSSMQDPSLRNQFLQDQGVTPSQQQVILKAQQEERRKELNKMAGALLLTDNDEQFKEGAGLFYDKLTAQEKEQFGAPDKWTRMGIGMQLEMKDSVDLYKAITDRKKSSSKSGRVIWGTDSESGEEVPYEVGGGNALQIPGVKRTPKGKGDKESESDKEYNRLVSTYSEDYPDIPKKDLEPIISRAKKNMGGFASEKTLDSEVQLLVDKYNEKRRDKLSLPSSEMMTGSDEWPPKFKAKGGQAAPASKRYGNKLTILD